MWSKRGFQGKEVPVFPDEGTGIRPSAASAVGGFAHPCAAEPLPQESLALPSFEICSEHKNLRANLRFGSSRVKNISVCGAFSFVDKVVGDDYKNSMSSTEAFLKSFHLENPGCTPACFSNGRADGVDSYSFLSSLLGDSHAGATVVDLACGDGALIRRILSRNIQGLQVVGVDMSLGELNLARKSLAESSVELIEARAQSLPFLNGSVDFIFCHMALMLMDELDLVISEVSRCLKLGGVFSAIVGGKSEVSPVFKSFLGLLKAALAEEGKTFLYNLGDVRTRSAEGLKTLFKEDNFLQAETKDLKLEFSAKPTEALDFFMLMYDVGLLSKSRREQLNLDLLGILEDSVDSQGLVNHYIWLRQVVSMRR